jgi:RNA polymerase sigma-70 factor (ECF subfamily)
MAAQPSTSAGGSVATAPASDAVLVAAVAHHQPGSVAILYGRYRDGSIGVAISVLGDEMGAEDVVQEVFEELPRMARSYDPRRGSVPQWLYRVVRNRAIDHVRRRAREASRITGQGVENDEYLLVPSLAPGPADELQAEELLELIGRLDPRHAHLVRLAFVDGWSHSAIAGLTGLPLGTVKTRIRLSLKLIRTFLAEADVTPQPGPTATTTLEARVVGPSGRGAVARSMRRVAEERYRVVTRPGIEAEDGRPNAIVLRATDAIEQRHLLERIDEVGWGSTPVVVRSSAGEPADVGTYGGPVITASNRGPGLPLRLAVPAALGVATRATIDDPVAQLLLADPNAAVVSGDRLGRITAASPGAAALYGRTQRQLRRSYFGELSGRPAHAHEREWQRLAARGWWAGLSALRLPGGTTREVYGVGWVTSSGDMLGVAAAPIRR